MRHTARMEEVLEAERAAEWLLRLENGGPEVRAEFARWLRESPRHVREILFASVVRNALKQWGSENGFNLDEIKMKAARSVVEIDVPEARPQTRHSGAKWRLQSVFSRTGRIRSGSSRLWNIAATLTFVTVLAFTAIAIRSFSDHTVATTAGEWRNIRLADGSLVRAGPRTRILVDIAEQRRRIRLDHGEIMVYVARDHSRPFYVETDLATAHAVGTAFGVRRVEPGQASVAVQEGTVAVARSRAAPWPAADSAVLVSAGKGVTVTRGDHSLSAGPVDLEKELAWVQERLILGPKSTLADAIRALNSRNETQIRLLDERLGMRPLRGVFSASDPTAFAATLEHGFPLVIVRENGDLVLMAQPGTLRQDSREH